MLLPSPDLKQQMLHLSGDHFAILYESISEWCSALKLFLQTGLQKGQKVVWLADDAKYAYLRLKYGAALDQALQDDQLMLLDADDFINNDFHAIIEGLHAHAQNYGMVRFSMDWDTNFHQPEQIIPFEILLHDFIHDTGSSFFCQYNLRQLQPFAVKAVLQTHPRIVRNNTLCHNIYYLPADIIMSNNKQEYEIKQWLDTIYTEDKLRRESSYLAGVVHCSSNPFAAGDINGNIIACNPAFEKLTGYTQEELHQINWFTLAPPFNHKDFAESVESRPETCHKSVTLLRKDGSLVPIDFMIQKAKFKDGIDPCYYGFVNDLTHHYQYEQDLLYIQEQLKERVIYLNTLIDHLNEFFITYDRNGIISFVNKKAQEMLGYTYNELIGKHFTDIIVPEYRAEAARKVRDRLKTGISSSYEQEMLTRSGIRRLMRTNCAPIRNGNKITGGMVLAQDITESRKAESDLRRQLELERLIASISGQFINLDYDAIDREIERALALMGQFTGADNSYIFLVSPDNNHINNTHTWHAPGVKSPEKKLHSLNMHNYRWSLNILKNNDYIYFPDLEQLPAQARPELEVLKDFGVRSFLAVPLRFGRHFLGFMGFTSIRRDHTWTKQDVYLLKVAGEIIISTLEHRRLDNTIKSGLKLFNELNEGVILYNQFKVVTWVNHAFSTITGFPAHQVINQTFDSLRSILNLDMDMHQQLLDKVGATGKWQGEIHGIRRDGEKFASYVSISAVKANPHFLYYVVLFVDATEQIKIQQERARLKEQTLTAQRLASLSTLSAGIVHEIAQPLNAIKILTDSMIYWHRQGTTPDAAEMMHKIQEIANEMERINEIIKSIRNYTNFNQNNLVKSSLNREVIRGVNVLKRQLSDNNITHRLSLDENLPAVASPPQQLEEVIVNLLLNAIQALNESDKSAKYIECVTFTQDDRVILEIRDNATGINTGIKDRLFEPFVTNKEQGMGIGLSIVHTIVSNLDGRIAGFNNDSGGATFRIELPAWRGENE